MKLYKLIAIVGLSFPSLFASATMINWVDWQSSTANTATGELLVGSETVAVNVSSTSAFAFVQTGTGTDFWTGSAYTNGTVDNAPPASEQIALNPAGTVTISFDKPIANVFFAINSWNNNTVAFDTPIVIDSSGAGYWGSGSANLNADSTGFQGVGELHGIILAEGDFSSISFSHTSENWHGFTLGVETLSTPPSVPAPATAVLLTALFVLMRRRNR